VRRRIFLIVLAIVIIGLLLSGLNDTAISLADTSVYDIETYFRQPETSNSSASGTITITMYTGDE